MKRLIVIPVLLSACIAFAQTPGAESNNNGGSQPAVNTPQITGAQTSQPGSDQAQPTEPTTVIIPEGASNGSADLLLEPKELPKKPLSLIGGTAVKVDPIRNRVKLQPFGGGSKITVRFDERSHIYRDGRETTVMGIHKGDRVYVDTMLLKGHVFAKNLRVATTTQEAEARGQILQAHPRRNEYSMMDSLTGQGVRFEVTPRTALQKQQGQAATVADLQPGSIVDVMFLPGENGGTARQVTVLAVPGEKFIFSGKVTNIDISTGALSIDNQTDDKNYTIYFNPRTVDDMAHLTVGTDVTAQATFDGQNYHARTVTLMPKANAEK